MQVHTFIADSAPDAVAQIRSQLGEQAVVLNVRSVPGEGLSRLWQKRRIEVLAYLPDLKEPPSPGSGALDFQAQLHQAQGGIPTPEVELQRRANRQRITSIYGEPPAKPESAPAPATGWRIGSYLQTSGMLPVHAERIVDELRALHGDLPPTSLSKEMEMAGALLRMLWPNPQRTSAQDFAAGTHVFVGAPGVGKTVCLCKWLAQTVLVHGRTARVWRLDGKSANTAEMLSVYAEILNVPVERSMPADSHSSSDLLFVDFPGVSWNDSEAMDHLASQLEDLPSPHVHLVLNAAYETSLLLAQVRAFSRFGLTDLIVTHLDEEPRWGKLWNIILGTNCSIQYLSAGQNIPGQWRNATAEEILAHQFPGK